MSFAFSVCEMQSFLHRAPARKFQHEFKPPHAVVAGLSAELAHAKSVAPSGLAFANGRLMPSSSATSYVLTLSCADRPGIVAAVSTYLFERGCNILDAQQFDDVATGLFFMRVTFEAQESREDSSEGSGEDAGNALRGGFEAIAERFAMGWIMRDVANRKRVMILASKFDHCLVDLVYRWRIGELPMDVAAIVSNHPRDAYSNIDFSGLDFHHLPVTKQTKLGQENEIWDLIKRTQTDVVVLARYMQILSDGLTAKLAGRCINIHHSFLPGFKGANPYTQAHVRGVKLIGATAHYVTGDLDEGPIIEQTVQRVTHAQSAREFVIRGREVEGSTLSRAVKWHAEHRVLLDGKRTVVFD